MTVEAYLRARIPGYPFDVETLEDAALSPRFAEPDAMQAISITDIIEEHADDEQWVRSLKYATSTLFYSAAGIFSGGSRSESVGDISASMSGFIITESDREYYRTRGDKIRQSLGVEIEESTTEQGGMFDAAAKRTRKPKRRWL